jgi:hypothetical protein
MPQGRLFKLLVREKTAPTANSVLVNISLAFPEGLLRRSPAVLDVFAVDLAAV